MSADAAEALAVHPKIRVMLPLEDDQVQLVGLGAPAEYGGFTGVVFNSETKSGSNAFSAMAVHQGR